MRRTAEPPRCGPPMGPLPTASSMRLRPALPDVPGVRMHLGHCPLRGRWRTEPGVEVFGVSGLLSREHWNGPVSHWRIRVEPDAAADLADAPQAYVSGAAGEGATVTGWYVTAVGFIMHDAEDALAAVRSALVKTLP